MERSQLEKMNVKRELLPLAAEHNIVGRSKMKKADLIEAILAATPAEETPEPEVVEVGHPRPNPASAMALIAGIGAIPMAPTHSGPRSYGPATPAQKAHRTAVRKKNKKKKNKRKMAKASRKRNRRKAA